VAHQNPESVGEFGPLIWGPREECGAISSENAGNLERHSGKQIFARAQERFTKAEGSKLETTANSLMIFKKKSLKGYIINLYSLVFPIIKIYSRKTRMPSQREF